MPWSELGKDGLDAAAETLWEVLRLGDLLDTNPDTPYHLAFGYQQEVVQRAVLTVIGQAVPGMLRDRARGFKGDPEYADLREQLREMADDIEREHGC